MSSFFAVSVERIEAAGDERWGARVTGKAGRQSAAEWLEAACVSGILAVAPLGRLEGSVRLDLDGDAREGKGELGVPGVAVLLDDGSARVTDGRGRFEFRDEVPATYQVSLVEQSLPQR